MSIDGAVAAGHSARMHHPSSAAAPARAASTVRHAFGAVEVRLVEAGADRWPVVHDVDPAAAGADLLAVALPPDVVALRRTDPAAARAWGSAVRGALAPAMAAGWAATGATRDGHYLLTRTPLTRTLGPSTGAVAR